MIEDLLSPILFYLDVCYVRAAKEERESLRQQCQRLEREHEDQATQLTAVRKELETALAQRMEATWMVQRCVRCSMTGCSEFSLHRRAARRNAHITMERERFYRHFKDLIEAGHLASHGWVWMSPLCCTVGPSDGERAALRRVSPVLRADLNKVFDPSRLAASGDVPREDYEKVKDALGQAMTELRAVGRNARKLEAALANQRERAEAEAESRYRVAFERQKADHCKAANELRVRTITSSPVPGAEPIPPRHNLASSPKHWRRHRRREASFRPRFPSCSLSWHPSADASLRKRSERTYWKCSARTVASRPSGRS